MAIVAIIEFVNLSPTIKSHIWLEIDLTLYTILQFWSITLFEKRPILKAFTADHHRNKVTNDHIQLKLYHASASLILPRYL